MSLCSPSLETPPPFLPSVKVHTHHAHTHDGGGDVVFVGAKCAALGIFRWRRTLLSVVCEAGALQSSLKMRLRQHV